MVPINNEQFDRIQPRYSLDKLNGDALNHIFNNHHCPHMVHVQDFEPDMLRSLTYQTNHVNRTVFFYIIKVKLNAKVVLNNTTVHNNFNQSIPKVQFVEALYNNVVKRKFPKFHDMNEVHYFINRRDTQASTTPVGPSFTWMLVDPGRYLKMRFAMIDPARNPNVVPNNFRPLPFEWLGLDTNAASGFDTNGLISKIMHNNVFAFTSYNTVCKNVVNLSPVKVIATDVVMHDNFKSQKVFISKTISGMATKYWIRKLHSLLHNANSTKNDATIYINKNTLSSSLWKETSRCVITPQNIDSIAYVLEPHKINVPIGLILAVTTSISKTYFPMINVDRIKEALPLNHADAVHKLLIPFIMISKDEIKIDKTRTSKRLGFGWAETPCNSHRHFTGVPCNEHNAFYPRMNASHFSPYAPMFLNNLMPILSSCYDAIKVSWKKEFPDLIDPISKLESYTNQLPFPHDLVLKLNSDGVPYLVTRNMDCITATRCCSRLSIALSAGKNCQLDLLKRVQVQYSNIEEKLFSKL